MNASDLDVVAAQKVACDRNNTFYQEQIGKSVAVPYFRGRDERAAVFDGSSVIPATNTCTLCAEPIGYDRELCSWCSVTDAHEAAAARSNPLRVLDHFGMLDDYIRGVEKAEQK